MWGIRWPTYTSLGIVENTVKYLSKQNIVMFWINERTRFHLKGPIFIKDSRSMFFVSRLPVTSANTTFFSKGFSLGKLNFVMSQRAHPHLSQTHLLNHCGQMENSSTNTLTWSQGSNKAIFMCLVPKTSFLPAGEKTSEMSFCWKGAEMKWNLFKQNKSQILYFC